MPRLLTRILFVLALTVLAEVLLIAMTILYMVLYSYLINPGHSKEFYEQHVQSAAPWLSITCGIPIFFVLGLWLATRARKYPVPANNVAKSVTVSAICFWLVWSVLDSTFILASGGMAAIQQVLPFWLGSHVSKALSIWAAVRFHRSRISA